MSDPLISALKKISALHPVVEFDMGNEIARANKLMERADGSFYTRGPTLEDLADEYEENYEE